MRYTARKVRIPSKGGSMKLLVLAPESGENRPGVLWIHGGGYVTGMAGMVWMSRA